jgi:transcriptional regulator with XRE-family HTH domain
MNGRLKLLRETLKLSQREFGEKIKISASAITNFESGFRNMSNQTIKIICDEFNVSEEWLRNGIGEMFVESDGTILAQLAEEYRLDEVQRKIIEIFVTLPERDRQIFTDFVRRLSDEFRAETAAELSAKEKEERDRQIRIAEEVRLLRERADALEKANVATLTFPDMSETQNAKVS